jgi:hypothetical protein
MFNLNLFIISSQPVWISQLKMIFDCNPRHRPRKGHSKSPGSVYRSPTVLSRRFHLKIT